MRKEANRKQTSSNYRNNRRLRSSSLRTNYS